MSRHRSKAEIKEALNACHGQVYLASERLSCWPSALYARIRKDAELQSIIDLYDGKRTDAAELKLEQAIRNGEPWAIALQLKTKGKTRGYTEKLEVETYGRLHVEIEPKVGPQLDREIRRVLEGLAADGQTSPVEEGDRLPPGFRSPHSLDPRA